MRLTLFLCSCAAWLALCSSVAAQDMTVFNMQLGTPMAIPECLQDKYLESYELYPKRTCYERVLVRSAIKKFDKKNPPPLLGTEEIQIDYPYSDRPEIVSAGGFVTAIVIDTKLEGISFSTSGITDAQAVLEKLKAKYGAPTALVPQKVRTRLGGQFETFIAEWVFQDVSVVFRSVTSNLDSGLVVIDTKKGRAWRVQRLTELLRDKNPL